MSEASYEPQTVGAHGACRKNTSDGGAHLCLETPKVRHTNLAIGGRVRFSEGHDIVCGAARVASLRDGRTLG